MSKRLPLSTRRQLSRLVDTNDSLASRVRPPQDRFKATMPQPPTENAASSSGNPFVLSSKHSNFQAVQAGRPYFDRSLKVETSKTLDPNWVYGKAINNVSATHFPHVEIDPYEKDRSFISNYKLLIAGIPRPISFVSTLSKNGQRNLAPFSYFQVVDHDPPLLVIGFSARKARPKDTRTNVIETGECVINIVSEHMIEAVNGTSLNVSFGLSKWELSGLQAAASTTVRPERVKDAVFSIEAKLLEMKELNYGHEGDNKPHGALAILQATRF